MSDEAANVTFVLEVKKYPCLYNFNLPEYSRRDITEKAWSTIAQQLNTTVSLCKEKWRNLRSVYLRRKKLPKIGEGRKSMKPYYLDEYLQFLHPYMKTMTPTTGNLPSPPVVYGEGTKTLTYQQDDTEEQVAVPTESLAYLAMPTLAEPTSCKIRKHSSTRNEVDEAIISFFRQKSSNGGNARKYFLLSLLPEVDELTEQKFRIFKRRVLALLDDISGLQSHSNLSNTNLLPSTLTSSPQQPFPSQSVDIPQSRFAQSNPSNITSNQYSSPPYSCQSTPTPSPHNENDFDQI